MDTAALLPLALAAQQPHPAIPGGFGGETVDLKKSLDGTDLEDIKKKTQNLIQVSMKLGEAVYKSQQKDPSAKPDDQESKTEDKNKEDVVDADFEDVKDTKDAKDSKEDKEKSA